MAFLCQSSAETQIFSNQSSALQFSFPLPFRSPFREPSQLCHVLSLLRSLACSFDKSILRCEFLSTKWSNGPALLPEIKLSSFIRFTNYILSSEMPHMPTLDMFLHQKLPGSHLINLIELFARPSCCETPKSTFFLLLQYKTHHLTFSCLFYIEALTIWMGIFVEFSFVTSRFSYLSFEDEDLFEFQ